MSTNITSLYGLGGEGGCKWKSQTFTASGLWTRPAGVEVVKIVLVGGGGGKSAGGNSYFGNLSYARGGGGFETSGSQPIANGSLPFGGIGGGFPGILGNGEYYSGSNQVGGGGISTPLITLYAQSYPHGAPGAPGPFGFSGGCGGSQRGWGGSIPTLGSGGGYSIAQNNTNGSGGGGGSYGNGGNGGSTNINPTAGTLGGGGGGAMGSCGGGGGEIIIREVPVSDNVFVTIGAGAAAYYSPSIFGIPSKLVSAAGGNGLCIVYWIG